MNLGECLHKTTQHFNKLGIPSSRLDAELLFSQALGLKRIDLYLRFDQPLNEEDLEKCRVLVKRRSKGEPVAYISGSKDFYNQTFFVDSNVLIPRPETEMIVDLALDFFKTQRDTPLKILDLGSGSGCIGLTLLKNLEQAALVAVDISAGAVDIAKKNAQSLAVAERVQFLNQDAKDLDSSLGEFDLVVANPPYIAENSPDVQSGVRNFEPHLALYSGVDGLNHLRDWSKVASLLTKSKGLALFEIGADQRQNAENIFTATKSFSKIEVLKDLAGLDRIVRAVKI
jgi:release factor glutamine methyltransferase